jgi:hypothetical protein
MRSAYLIKGSYKMGLSCRSSSSLESSCKTPNPNPKNFEIKKVAFWGEYVAVMVNYPDCTNFEGNKILIFKSDIGKIKKWCSIDPHFFPSESSPIARFRPTKQGWKDAEIFIMIRSKLDKNELTLIDGSFKYLCEICLNPFEPKPEDDILNRKCEHCS